MAGVPPYAWGPNEEAAAAAARKVVRAQPPHAHGAELGGGPGLVVAGPAGGARDATAPGEQGPARAKGGVTDDGRDFWEKNPRGIPVAALFGDQGGAGEVGRRIKGLDVSGDGFLSKEEFRGGVTSELKAIKSRKQLVAILTVLGVFGVCLIAVVVGLTFVVVDLAKDTEASPANGNLLVRNGERALPNGTKVAQVVRTEDKELESLPLSSCMPDSYFKEMKQFSIEDGLVKLAIEVQGFVRLPRPSSVYGSVVGLVTPIGRITLDAEMIEFTSEVGDVLAEAGFTVESGQRRLNGLYELSAFFNAVPLENYGCFNEKSSGPKPSFPERYTADVTVMYNCDPAAVDGETQGEGKDRCANMPTKGLVERTMYGNTLKFAVGYAKAYVDLVNKRSREEWYFPGRTEAYGLVTINRIAANPPKSVGKSQPSGSSKWKDTYMVKRTDGKMDNSKGYWCDLKESRGQDSIALVPEEAKIAFEGVHALANGREGRSFTYNVNHNEQTYLYRFKDRWTDAQGDPNDEINHLEARYVMYEIELWDTTKNVMLMMYKLDNMNVTWRAPADSPLFQRPYTCHSTEMDDGPLLTRAEFLGTPIPFADGDWAKIEGKRYRIKTEDAMLGSVDTQRFETVMADDGSKKRRRKLHTTDEMDIGNGYTGRHLTGNTCCKYYYDGQRTGIAEEFSFNTGTSPVAIGVDFGFVQSSGVKATSRWSAMPTGPGVDICKVAANVALDLTPLPLVVSGEIYADWKPPFAYDECWEVGGCLAIALGYKKSGFEFVLVEATLCFYGGRYEVNGCPRSYLAVSVGAGVSVMADTNIGKFGVGISGSVDFKWFLPNDKCENIVDGVDEGWRANQLDFDPYFQLDWELCFFICYTDSWATHFMGPEPGRMMRQYHGRASETPDLPDGIFDGVSLIEWDKPDNDPINQKAGMMATTKPLAGFVRTESTSGKRRDGDLTNLEAGVQMDFAQAYNLMDPSDESGFKPQDMESYDCRIVAGDFGGDYGLIGKNNKGWLECSGDEWAFGFRRKAPKAVYKTIQVEEGSECNCAIPRRCDKNQGRCRWGPKMVDKDVFDYWDHPIDLIDGWKCCKVRIPAEKKKVVPRNCDDTKIKDDMTRSAGYAQCKNTDPQNDKPRAATGMWRDRDKAMGVACGEDELGCIETLKCCEGILEDY